MIDPIMALARRCWGVVVDLLDDTAEPGWYPDPGGRGWRYWDGTGWDAESLPGAPEPDQA